MSPHHSSRVLLALLLAAATAACGGAHSSGTSRARNTTADGRSVAERCAATSDTDGVLSVRNFSGGTVEIHVVRQNGDRNFIGSASPGNTTFPVPGPADLGAVYGVFNPNEGRIIGGVSWMRPRSQFTQGGVVLELTCLHPG